MVGQAFRPISRPLSRRTLIQKWGLSRKNSNFLEVETARRKLADTFLHRVAKRFDTPCRQCSGEIDLHRNKFTRE